MPSVELRVDVFGSDGIPHTFIVVTDSNSVSVDYGFVPAENGKQISDGDIVVTVDHEFISTTGPMDLTDAQYETLMNYIRNSDANPPQYNIFWGAQCANWAVLALQQVGIPGIYPNIFPDNLLRDLFETIIWNPYTRALNIEINNLWNTATNWRRPLGDPLAIDLDGDGIETIGIPTDGSTPVLFDHNADGVRTGTGWLRPDDAWLVLDRDGNGSIDSGRELFGVDTQITVTQTVDGTPYTYQRFARTGFEALRTLDANADLQFDALDAAFTQARLWQDANGDGISQASELFTLAEQGIVRIALTESTATTNLGNGNTVTGTATVTRSNGGSTLIDSIDLTAGNLILAENGFNREFTDTIAWSPTARALPEMGGSGWVRDMREAMSLGTAMGTRPQRKPRERFPMITSIFPAGASRKALDNSTSFGACSS